VSIQKFYGNYTLVCDTCDARLGAADFYDAVDMRKRQGWRARKDPETGEWYDTCPECLREEREARGAQKRN